MQPKLYTLNEILAILALTPESLFRDYGRVRILDPNSRDPKFVPVLKGNDDIVDLPGDAVDIMSIGFAGEGNLRISVTGDMPVELATQLFNAINWRILETDGTNNATYGFFYARDDKYSHFLKVKDSPEAIRLGGIHDKAVMTKFEFAGLLNGTLVLSILADNHAYQTEIRPDDIRGMGIPNFRWTCLDTKVDVLDISSRVIDNKVVTMLATRDGIFVCLDKEIVHYEATRGMVVPVISGWFAGRFHHPITESDKDTAGRTIGFIGQKGKEIDFFLAPLKQEGKVTAVSLDPSFRTYLRSDDVRVIPGNDYRWYVGAVDQMAAIEAPRIS